MYGCAIIRVKKIVLIFAQWPIVIFGRLVWKLQRWPSFFSGYFSHCWGYALITRNTLSLLLKINKIFRT
jgi:hypothetical protein